MASKEKKVEAPVKSLDKAPFNVVSNAGEIVDQFTTSFEAFVCLRDTLKLKGKVLDAKGGDITKDVIPVSNQKAGASRN